MIYINITRTTVKMQLKQPRFHEMAMLIIAMNQTNIKPVDTNTQKKNKI